MDDKTIDDVAENARWTSFIIEYAFAVITYILIKAFFGLACAELFMLIAFAIALCASTKSASELVKIEMKKNKKKEELSGNKEKYNKEDQDKNSDNSKDA